MTIFMCPPSDDDDEINPTLYAEKRALRDRMLTVRQALQEAEAEERRLAASRNRVATFRIPTDLLARFDEIASEAATSRGHMLRQVIAEYICYVDECNVRYRGSMLTAHNSKRAHRI